MVNARPTSDASVEWKNGLLALAATYPRLALESPGAIRRVESALNETLSAGATFAFADYACVTLALEGDTTAIRAVIECLRPLKKRLERFKSDGIQPDDVCADLELRLFDKEAPVLSRYSGRGSLEGWLRVLLSRAALDTRRQRGAGHPHLLAEDLPHLRAPIADPELEAVRRRSTEVFREAFYDALAELSADHRAALRLHLHERLTLDETARALGVHRATAARWLAAARDELFTTTRRLLAERLQLRVEDCESLSRFVLSQVELSLSRVLET